MHSFPSLLNPFAPPFTNTWSFSGQPTGQKIQKAELFPTNSTFLPPPYTSTKLVKSALFSILIVISFDRTCSPSLNAQITNAILFSSSSSLVTNIIACTRGQQFLKKTSQPICAAALCWELSAGCRKVRKQTCLPTRTKLCLESKLWPFSPLWGDNSLFYISSVPHTAFC